MPDQINLGQLLGKNTMASAPELVIDEGNGVLRCVACGHRCSIHDGKTGVCRVRFNSGGTIRVPAGYVGSLQIDPIEKKPFFHVYPGSDALSFGMLGCDYHCSYCQNWVTSQALRDDQAVSMPKFSDPASLADLAVKHGALVVVSTYNEPLITADWAMMVFREAADRGLKCGFVSNGNATPEVLEFIRPLVELYKVDLKGFDDRKYRALGGALDNVLNTIRLLQKMDFWVEIVTLTIPGFNDSDDELSRIADFIAGVSIDIPWHVTAFHPDYKMSDTGRTPVDTLVRAHEIGRRAGLRFVYAGNIPGAVGERENTRCPHCDALLLRRQGFTVLENRMAGDLCPSCNKTIPGVWGEQTDSSTAAPRIPRPISVR